jgi:hypothetical protein
MWMPTLLIANVHDYGYGDANFVYCQSPINLSVPLVLEHTIDVPFWNQHIENYVYGVYGFVNKYFCPNIAVVVFHIDDPCVFKEIKSYSKGNGYKI